MKTAGEGVWTRSIRLGDHGITIETGRIARQANGAVLIRQGDTTILVTAVAADRPRPGADFFPLTVEYRERFSAAGKFPGGYRKREGRITDHEILSSRLIDRTVRPLFPDGYHSEVQIQATVLSYEPGTDPETLAITGAAAALHVSDIPFDGPVAGVRMVMDAAEEWRVCTPAGDDARCDLAISVGTRGLVMMEGEALELPEQDLIEAVRRAGDAVKPLLDLMGELRAERGRAKAAIAEESSDPGLMDWVREIAGDGLREALQVPGKKERAVALEAIAVRVRDLAESAEARPEGSCPWSGDRAVLALADLESEILRRNILEGEIRADGRNPRQIRRIEAVAGAIPRVHGSALFTRGETQALAVLTLGTGRDEQEVESLDGTVRDRFLLFYSFPPYSVGETRPLRGPGRREIGHGNLARRALEGVLPPAEAFPYTIKLESEITESNGSSSMATVCAGCLALMDGGVPVRRPVAGIAMGLICDGERTAILSDILGVEDHLGDMDFKVAGTEEGICAVQLDNKIGSLPFDVLEGALGQAREGRLHILQEMRKALSGPRGDLSPLAPRVAIMKIAPHRIRDLIGPGGRHIQDLQADTGTRVDVQDDGTVRVYAQEAGALPHARRRILDLTGEPEVGKFYRGTVTGVKEFGCFVRLFQGIEGLVHASELAPGPIRDTAQVATEGDEMVVKVLGVDNGRIALSRRQAMDVRGAEIENP